MLKNLGTVWVCVDCMLHHANGECGSCHEEHDAEPLGLIGHPSHVAMGMAAEEHSEDCRVRITGEWTANEECDCDRDTFSRSRCEGCGSYLHGERYAMTLFGEADEEYACHYLTGPVNSARTVYHAPDLTEAMRAHNRALPDYADRVLKWVGPSGITFLMHDSSLR